MNSFFVVEIEKIDSYRPTGWQYGKWIFIGSISAFPLRPSLMTDVSCLDVSVDK
jgi:hypothetical protein